MANTKHGCVRLDNVTATKNGSLIKSVKYMGNGATATSIDNGNFVTIGGLATGEREIHNATTPTASTTYFGLVCTPEVIYDQIGVGDTDLANFTNDVDEVARVIILGKGDIFSVTAEALDTVPTVGKIIELQAGTKGKVVTNLTTGSTKVGEVVAIEVNGSTTWYVIEVK